MTFTKNKNPARETCLKKNSSQLVTPKIKNSCNGSDMLGNVKKNKLKEEYCTSMMGYGNDNRWEQVWSSVQEDSLPPRADFFCPILFTLLFKDAF